MEWITAMQQAITYMEEHLLEDVNYEDVAKQIYISNYEFHRAFSFLTGMTANAYIRSRRLSLAAREIVETDASITEIALKYGYDTPEGFTKAFTRFHGIAPKFARDGAAKLKLFNPLVIKISVEGGKTMDYKIVQTKAQKFIALVRSFKNEIINDDENHEIPDFWAECNEKQMLGPLYMLRPDGKRDLYGLCTPTCEGSETFEYGIGIIADEDTAQYDEKELKKAGFRIWDVKPGTYVVFECIGDDGDCISDTWAKFYKEFLPQMGYEAEEETDYEKYF
ncbi:helix-turn-helix domain-containing protein, partial [Ruminococcus flavefaciens]|uniref:AraC family transcriptional regulator n=1 Tax=Ruminococcus flavefaciens TaxID=1265 RepID=UPI0013DBCAF1